MGVSLRWDLLGEMLWSACEKDWSARADDGTCSDACGREGTVASLELDGCRTGKMVHRMLWEATRELGSHGVTAT